MQALTQIRSSVRSVPATALRPAPGASAIDMMGMRMEFRRNVEIYGEDEPADYLYKVVSGAVRTSRLLADGRRQIGAFYLPGDVFGLEDGDVHSFSERQSEVARELWSVTSRELHRAQEHLVALIKTAEERVVSFLLEMAGRVPSGDRINLPMSRQDIADYLGLTIETVSRTMTHLESVAAIALPTSRCVVLTNRARLGRLNG
jgi:CRP/FNR family transcriptional regulator, nitrogen fixation regulation protein